VPTLVRKLLRDIWLPLAVVCLLLGAFQCLWVKITQRISGELVPLLDHVSRLGGVNPQVVQDVLFQGPGQVLRTLMGGERIQLDNAMNILSIGYVHPLMQTIFCIWAIGRAASAIAGELDRGTMELLLAQPLPRYHLVLAHLCVDAITIPVLCLSLWGGTWLGDWLIGPIQPIALPSPPVRPTYLVELGPLKVRLQGPADQAKRTNAAADLPQRLRVRPGDCGPALWVVGGLLFAVSGYSIWLSSAGRFRNRVLGLAVLLTLLQFLINLVGQLWDAVALLRPLTIFYYYQPQRVILGRKWTVNLSEWNGGEPLCAMPMLAVLFGVGAFGYSMALWTFSRRDLPAPL
jgi:ABC-2 type transport system permease protein